MEDSTQTFNFFGSDYDESRDYDRMAKHTKIIFAYLQKYKHIWSTLGTIANNTGVPLSSVGSHISYIRRDAHYKVDKMYIHNGLYGYRLGAPMTQQEILELQVKKHKPVGDKVLHGKYMQALYVQAHDPSTEHYENMRLQGDAWQIDMLDRIRKGL